MKSKDFNTLSLKINEIVRKFYKFNNKEILERFSSAILSYVLSRKHQKYSSIFNDLRKIYEKYYLNDLANSYDSSLTHNSIVKTLLKDGIINEKISNDMNDFWRISSDGSHNFKTDEIPSLLNLFFQIIEWIENRKTFPFSLGYKIISKVNDCVVSWFENQQSSEVKIVEIIKEVPFEVVKEVPVEVVKEVPVEKVIEIIKEVPVEKVIEIIKEVPVEKVVEVFRDVPHENITRTTIEDIKSDSLAMLIGKKTKLVKPNDTKSIYKRHFFNNFDYEVDENGLITLKENFKNKLDRNILWGRGLGLGWKKITPTFMWKMLDDSYHHSEYLAFLNLIRINEPIFEMKYIEAGNILEETIYDYLSKNKEKNYKNKIDKFTGEVLKYKSLDTRYIKEISRKHGKNWGEYDLNMFMHISNWLGGQADGLVLYTDNPFQSVNEVLEIKTTQIKNLEYIKIYGPRKEHIFQASTYAYVLGNKFANISYYFLKDDEYKLSKEELKESFDPSRLMNFRFEVDFDDIEAKLKTIKRKVTSWRTKGISPLPKEQDYMLVELAKARNKSESDEIINKYWGSKYED